MLDFGFYNEDCLPRMKEYPDNYFSLAIVDPPYGGGFTEGGGCQGWFQKYHQSDESSQICQVERERETDGAQAEDCDSTVEVKIQKTRGIDTLSRTGGTWAQKYGKKLYRGM